MTRFALSSTAVVLLMSLPAPFALGADGGVRVSKEELPAVLSGAKVTYANKAGLIRHFTNEPNGKFIASTDTKAVIASGRFGGTAPGKWSISEDGRYCVDIDWKTAAEKWCEFIYRMPDGSYSLAASDDPAAERRKIDLKK